MTAETRDVPVAVWAQLAAERRADAKGRVLDLVLMGKLTPQEAEAWALRNAQPLFATTPDPVMFNPMFEPAWTLAMAAEWIIRRTPEAVRERWADYVQECWVWCPSVHRFPSQRHPGTAREAKGFELRQRAVCTAGDVLERAQFDLALDAKELSVVPAEARRELTEALTSGKLTAYAGPEQEPVPSQVWLGVSPFRSPIRRGLPDAVYGEDRGAPRLRNVRVFRDAVSALWPSEPAKRPSKIRGRPPGSGSMISKDLPLVKEAVRRFEAGEPQKVVLADLAIRADGSLEIASRVKRLQRGIKKYREQK